MGRSDGDARPRRMGQDDQRRDEQQATGQVNQTATETLPFYPHTTPYPLQVEYEPYGVYIRAATGDHILGSGKSEEDGTTIDAKLTSLCFNCGSEEHAVKDCPFRRNKDLIDLSRQYYMFSRGSLGTTDWQRVHVAEGWRQTRLNWLEEFEPGEVRGTLLREALGASGDGQWLENIALWGYPKGWVAERDPRELVRERIWREHGGDVDAELDEDEPFTIFGDDEQQSEVILFQGAFQPVPHPGDENESIDSQSSHSTIGSEAETDSSEKRDGPHQETHRPSKRWATYPRSHFLSDILPVYVPCAPKFDWDAWAASHVPPDPPPPPTEAPPPLPPSPTSHGPPPPPPSSPPPAPPPFEPTHSPHPVSLPAPFWYTPSFPIPSVEPDANSDMELSDSD